jgi:16S rRNA C967 or C1407 C5-methylase (RsmB/RsmF family)/NOL1/NOP2/fmu family ribosome biogenesis protein
MTSYALPEAFLKRMQTELGKDYLPFIKSYEKPPVKAIRVNTLKLSSQAFLRLAPFAVTPEKVVPWEQNGYYVTEEKVGRFWQHFAGLYYAQEPSAMCAAPLVDAKKGERILDLCSAPGGKGTRLAEGMQGEGVLILNEINFSRAKILLSNVERMGIKNAVVTCASPEKLAACFPAYFDKILVDAPCSGEGMFKKEPNAITEWSPENVALCAKRQTDILACADRMLRAGGRLVYSTCTFAKEEDELQIEQFLKSHPAYTLASQEKLLPHVVEGEGHFAAVLTKGAPLWGDGESGNAPAGADLPLFKTGNVDKKHLAIYRAFEKETLAVSFERLFMAGEHLCAAPKDMPVCGVQTLRAGLYLGDFKGDRFEPAHALAMALKADEVKTVEVSEPVAIDYLKGNTFACSQTDKGWRVVTCHGFPLGWCKCSSATAKNHYPKGLRMMS